MTEIHPFFKLAPYKIEMMYINPDIFLFYNVLNDADIKNIKKLARQTVSVIFFFYSEYYISY